MTNPSCPYCNKRLLLAKGDEVYLHRSDLKDKDFWACWNCEAWVGCHPGTIKPMGPAANKATRKARSDAHAAFDPLWRPSKKGVQKSRRRREAYQWLASRLKIEAKKCHIGMMNIQQCRQVIEICGEKR